MATTQTDVLIKIINNNPSNEGSVVASSQMGGDAQKLVPEENVAVARASYYTKFNTRLKEVIA